MNASASTPSLIDLIVEAQRALHFTQLDVAKVTGASVRTIQRWMQGSSAPSKSNLERLVAALQPVDRVQARRLAEVAGLEAPPPVERATPPSAAPTVVSLLVEAVVAAAAEALQLPPQSARPALLAAMERAEQAGLSVGQLLEALKTGT